MPVGGMTYHARADRRHDEAVDGRESEGTMRRQKKFYAWGYADEDLTPEEITPWETDIARSYGLYGFDILPPPKADEIALCAPRLTVPAALQSIVRTDHLTRLEHSY